MSRRLVISAVLALVLMFAFSSVALAELPKASGGTSPTNTNGTSPNNTVTPPTTETNGTGYNSPTTPGIKYDTPTNKVIHSNYSANTDACASCHATHTAVGGALLQWRNPSEACMACHDGTVTSTYDVKNGLVGSPTGMTATKTSGGLFGQGTEAGLSHHNVTGGMKTAAAMGGSENSTLQDTNGNWGTDFNCAACHTPHGQGGNSRILKADPNGVALANKVTGETLSGSGTVYQASKANWIAGYPYSQYTKVYVGGVQQTSGFTIDYRNGKVTFTSAPGSAVTADYVPGIRVQLAISNKLTASETVSYTGGINQFCAACHTDYNTDNASLINQTDGSGKTWTTISGHTLTGTYRKAYRHGVGMVWDDTAHGTTVVSAGNLKFQNVNGPKTQGTVICLTCHFAHGTDDAFAGGTTSDTGRGTVLKRQVNMSVCETCHQKGAVSNY